MVVDHEINIRSIFTYEVRKTKPSCTQVFNLYQTRLQATFQILLKKVCTPLVSVKYNHHCQQPSDVAKATILSSCPCDHDLHYVITTEGHVTYWSQSEASTEDLNPPSAAIDGAAICRMNFRYVDHQYQTEKMISISNNQT